MPDLPFDLRSTTLRTHVRIALGLVAVWAVGFAVNLALLKGGVATGATATFPVSVFTPRVPSIAGILWAVAFVGLVALAAVRGARLGRLGLWAAAFVLIAVGNLIQGNAEAAFVAPLAGDDGQYLHDAFGVGSWTDWLAAFNDRQPELSTHGRTHPPFAVLVHVAGLRLFGNVLGLGLAMTALTALAAVVVAALAEALGGSREQSALLALLAAAVPSVAIYGAVSLDGLVLAASAPFLLGLVRTLRAGRFRWTDAGWMALGLTLSNLLTYGGVFLIAAGGLVALVEAGRQRWGVAAALAVAVAALAVVLVGLDVVAGYDPVRGFLTASRLENPDGFRGFSEPLAYAVTRAEGVAEIALFLSLGVLTRLVWLARHRRTNAAAWLVAGAGVVALGAMFLAGAYRTGETARAALFLVPYLLLPLASERPAVLRTLILAAGLQTAAMQLAGAFFW